MICDADHRVLYYKTGLPGSGSDAGSWVSTDFYQAMENGNLNIPEESEDRVTFHFLADNGFALDRKMVVPFNTLTSDGNERDFNYRHSRHYLSLGRLGFKTRETSFSISCSDGFGWFYGSSLIEQFSWGHIF